MDSPASCTTATTATATTTTTAKPQQDSSSLSKAAARKIKKRELDRKAQRLARERTKNRIQELESLVELLKAEAFNPNASDLTATLSQITQQRDELQNALRSIDQTIQRFVRERPSSISASSISASSISASSISASSISASAVSASSISSVATALPGPYTYHHQQQLGNRLTRSCNVHGVDAGGSFHAQSVTEDSNIKVGADADGSESIDANFWQHVPPPAFRPPAVRQATCGESHQQPVADTPLTAADMWDQQTVQLVPDEQPQASSTPAAAAAAAAAEDIIVPRPAFPCDCVQTTGGVSNTWRKANNVLGRSTALSPAQLAVEDFTSEDTPVWVVLDGWDTVAKAGKMSLSWKKLRQIDRTCFPASGDVERLAILRIMHLLITYHGDPSPERHERVPRWLWTRPSQMIPHSYAIDFFVWPGLRERFIFSQHRYCTNRFWQLFGTSLKINWPYGLADCYGVDADTGRYVLSPQFDAWIRDINAWRMTADFFADYPELYEDIPVAGSIPPAVACSAEEVRQMAGAYQRSRRRLLTQQALRRQSAGSTTCNGNNSHSQADGNGITTGMGGGGDGCDDSMGMVLSIQPDDPSAGHLFDASAQLYDGIPPYAAMALGAYAAPVRPGQPECPWPSV